MHASYLTFTHINATGPAQEVNAALGAATACTQRAGRHARDYLQLRNAAAGSVNRRTGHVPCPVRLH